MGDVDVRLLDGPPSIPALFARAVATSRGRRGAAGSLPRHRLVLPGVEQDLARLRDYCEVTGDVLGDTVPATWLHVLTFPLQVRLMADRSFPFAMVGMVHVANSMTLHRPVRVAETLVLSTWTENLQPHRRGHTVDLCGEVRVQDEVVWEGRSTYLARSSSSDDQQAEQDRPNPSSEGSDGPVPTAEMARWRLPAGLGRQYAAVSGDANPIHLTGVTAKAFGFPRAIAHGMWTHARVLAAVRPRVPEVATVDVQFRKPVLLPSTVVLRGELEPDGARLAVTDRDGGRLHLTMQVGRAASATGTDVDAGEGGTSDAGDGRP
ncbi:MaoC family dehydratase [Ornithinimicrobium sp. W1679]|uniref:MaoC family dehydratase n=1 Tax=unclassified Ornithinimicrobium TaxID=2615080 RepID=UPI003CF4B4BE